jgi:hypothetical protein
MARMSDWQIQFEQEIERAQSARTRKNEGQARVCARRAAGIAIRAYLTRRGEVVSSPSAVDLLAQIAASVDLAPALRQSAEYLTLRVNEQFKLPDDVDLIKEAVKLKTGLLE